MNARFGGGPHAEPPLHWAASCDDVSDIEAIERGARTTLWDAAALGLMDRVHQHFSGDRPPAPDQITAAFWGACHGAQLSSAQYLLSRGANLNWDGYDRLRPLDAATRSGANYVVDWLRSQGATPAKHS